MTGIVVRRQHEGQWQSVDIDALTEDELWAFLAGRDASELMGWIAGLVGWIRDNVHEEAP
jgi:hypothetical protein